MKTVTHDQIPGSAEAKALGNRVRELRKRQRSVSLGTGLARVTTAGVGLLAIEMLADWRIELPWPVRCLLLSAGLCAALWLLFTRYFPRLSDDEIALMVERAIPIFRGRYIASVQLAKSREHSGSAELIHALLAETVELQWHLDFRRVVNTDKLKRAILIGAASLAVGVALLCVGSPLSFLLLSRALLSNESMPRATRIVGVTGERMIARGDDLAIEATAEGVVPPAGKVIVKTRSGQVQELPFERDASNPAHFRRLVENAQEPFSYSLRLNDAATSWYAVTVLPRPTVAGLECEQVYPPYTRLGRVRRGLGDLTLLAGSRLELKIKASSDIKQATVQLAGSNQDLPIQIDPRNQNQLSVSVPIPIKDATGFSIHLTDQNGITSKDSAIHRFEIVPDRPPTVKIRIPVRQEELVTPQGVIIIGFEASDDFWIGKATLHYTLKPEGAAETVEKTVELDVGENQKTLFRRFEWKIASLTPRPTPGSVIDYWMEVADTNDVTGPGIGTTTHYCAKIVTPEEKRAELAKRLMNSFQGLNDVTIDEEKLNKELRTIIDEKQTK